MNSFTWELKRAIRRVWNYPRFTVLALLPLALGIGANTTIFSAIHAVLLRSLPYNDPDRLMHVSASWPSGPGERITGPLSVNNVRAWRDWRDSQGVFEGIAAHENQSFNLTGGIEPIRIEGQRVSPKLLDLLGVAPLHGRYFSEDEETPGKDRVVILSYPLWQRLFAGDVNLLGRSVRLDGIAYTVVGIMPAHFRFPDEVAQLWVPFPLALPQLTPGKVNVQFVSVIAKLFPNVTVERAEAEASAFLAHYSNTNTNELARQMDQGIHVVLTSLQEELVRPIRPALLILSLSVGIVLLVVCANVTHLFLVRGLVRRREMALRTAVGAGHLDLVITLFTESLVYSLLGGALGIAVAFGSLQVFRFFRPSDLPRLGEVSLNGTVLVFNLAVSLLVALLAGLAPALKGARVDPASEIQASTPVSCGKRTGLLQRSLAISEVALALVLLIASGVALESFLSTVTIDPGYETRDILTFRLNLPKTRYPNSTTKKVFYGRLLASLEDVRGVVSIGLVKRLPLDRARLITNIRLEGRPLPGRDPRDLPRATIRVTSPGFFQTMNIRLLKGRSFTEGDAAGTSPVLVNELLAQRYFVKDNPLGARIARFGEILGVVSNARQQSLDEPPEPEVYLHYKQIPESMESLLVLEHMSVVLRYDQGQQDLLERLTTRLREIDPELPLADIRTMDQRVNDSMARMRLYNVLLGLFAALTLFVALSGVYSVVSYGVSQRMREIAVRLAIGATPAHILKLALIEGWSILFFGVAGGLTLLIPLQDVLRSLFLQAEGFDLPIVLGVTATMVVVVLSSGAFPVRKTFRTDIMTILNR